MNGAELVACPTCGAGIGEPCRRKRGAERIAHHSSRRPPVLELVRTFTDPAELVGAGELTELERAAGRRAIAAMRQTVFHR